MVGVSLNEVAILLAALAIAGPLARWLGISAVLGYLVAGMLLGPNTLGWSFSNYKAQEILHFAEFGIVLLLFLIGLELRPKRLWAMRNAVFGLGSAQVLLTGAVLSGIGLLIGFSWQTALFAGLALALSSTALALQVMEETGDLPTRHGRLGFSVLLFQDLAAIPLIAFAPLFATAAVAATVASSPQMDFITVLEGLGLIAVIVIVGHFVLDYFLRLVALTRVKAAMTAAALLTVVGVTILMQQAGLSASLGAFIAGALLAEFLLSPPARGRHPAVRGAAARPVLHRHRHVYRRAAVARRADHHPDAGRRPDRHQGIDPLRAGPLAGTGAGAGAAPRHRAVAGRRVRLRAVHRRLCGGRADQREHRAADHHRRVVDGGDADPAQDREPAVASPQGAGAHLRHAARQRRPRDHRRLRPRRADRRPHPHGQAHPVHGARHQRRAGGVRAPLRRPGVLRRRQPAGDPRGGRRAPGARLRAGHRRRRSLDAHRRAGALDATRTCRSTPGRATATTRTGCSTSASPTCSARRSCRRSTSPSTC